MAGSTQNSMRFVGEIVSFVSKPLFMSFQMQSKIEFCVLFQGYYEEAYEAKNLGLTITAKQKMG